MRERTRSSRTRRSLNRSRWLDRFAALGFFAWLVGWGLRVPSAIGLPIVERVVALGPLVAAPMALALASNIQGEHPFHRAAFFFQPFASACAFGAIFLGVGIPGGVLAGVWLLQSLLLAGVGLVRLRAGAWRDVGEMAVSVGLLYVPVGAAWFVASRMGWNPLGFRAAIVLLTAAHFHFAGMSAAVIAGGVARRLGEGSKFGRAGVICVALGPMFVALGITLSPLIEVISAVALALAMLVVAVSASLEVAPRLGGFAAGLFRTAHAVLLITMTLAITFALGEYLGHLWVSIPRMAQWHGLANAMGYALVGLAALRLASNPAQSRD